MAVAARSRRYSGSTRPACRMNHTGVCSVDSPRHARRNGASRSSDPPVGAPETPRPGAAVQYMASMVACRTRRVFRQRPRSSRRRSLSTIPNRPITA